MTLELTESLHVNRRPSRDGWDSGGCMTIMPGPVDADYIREVLGDREYQIALDTGVLRRPA